MSGQWWESNPIVGPFSNITEANAWAAANPSSLFQGLLATINGVPYSWSGSAWGAAGGGGGLPVFASYAALPEPTLGLLAQIPRLCGNGYFALRANGTRWEVCPGESIIRDAGLNGDGYGLTATSSAYVTLASYTIPAGLIATGEEWEGDVFASSPGPHGGYNSYPRMRVNGASMLVSNYMTAAGRTCRCIGAFACLSSTLTVAPSDVYQNGYVNADVAFNSSNAIAIDIGIAPGAIGDVLKIRYACFRRIG